MDIDEPRSADPNDLSRLWTDRVPLSPFHDEALLVWFLALRQDSPWAELRRRAEEVEMKAEQIMTPNPAVVTPDEPVMAAARLMRDNDVGMIPVVDDKDSRMLKGVITDRDIVIRCVAEGHKPDCPVREHMTVGKIDTARVDEDVNRVVARMEHDQIRRIPVVREDHRLAGVIAQADVARKLAAHDPDMVSDLVERVSEPGRAAARDRIAPGSD